MMSQFARYKKNGAVASIPSESQAMHVVSSKRCRKCTMPFKAHDTMRRNCCPYGFVHLKCIENEDLKACHACRKDPLIDRGRWDMVDLVPGDPNGFFPEPPTVDEGHLTCPVDRTNLALRQWKKMFYSTLEELTSVWTERIWVKDIVTRAVFLDGTSYQKGGPKRDIKRVLNEDCALARELFAEDVFLILAAGAHKFDKVVEVMVSFNCIHWTRRQEAAATEENAFKFEEQCVVLGSYKCFICLSGLAQTWPPSKPRATRAVWDKVKCTPRWEDLVQTQTTPYSTFDKYVVRKFLNN